MLLQLQQKQRITSSAIVNFCSFLSLLPVVMQQLVVLLLLLLLLWSNQYVYSFVVPQLNNDQQQQRYLHSPISTLTASLSLPSDSVQNHNHYTNHCTITSSTILCMILSKDKLFTNDVYDTIQNGKIAVIPEFITKEQISILQNDANSMYENGYFTTDALASYGTNGNFDISHDRAVTKLQQWKNPIAGIHYKYRTNELVNLLSTVRTDLANNLYRPNLNNKQSQSITNYGQGSTEISYTRFGPNAFLQRHVDEHHEELKGYQHSWIQPTRRSISWLIYLNDPTTWNIDINGGCLRCYERSSTSSTGSTSVTKYPVGSRNNGDLQIGWLRPTYNDPIHRPVFLDAQVSLLSTSFSTSGGNNDICALYIDDDDNDTTFTSTADFTKKYISKTFTSHPTLFIAGGEFLLQKLYMKKNNNKNIEDYSKRFYLIETPKTRIHDLMSQLALSKSTNADETIVDIPPLGGTLVLFDSVSLPHEVLPSYKKSRWALSGWFHEDQQSILSHPYYTN